MILVAGATGTVGRHVVEQLAAEGHPVRALTRKPGDARFPAHVEVAQGSLTDLATLPAALAGVRAVYLLAHGDRPADLFDLVKQAGVGQVVLLSTGFVDDTADVQPNAIAARHRPFELAAHDAGLAATFLRPTEFANNALQWAPQIAAGDVVRGPYGAAQTAPIHEHDLAEVAVRVLVDGGPAGGLALTGPESLSHADQARLIGDAIGRDIRFEDLPPEVWREQASRYAPAAVIDAMLGALAGAVDRPAEVSPVVAQILGRPARAFADWARDHANDFR